MARTHGSIGAFILVGIASLIIGAATACEHTARGAKQDAQQVEAETRDERAEAAAKARDLGDDVAHAAGRAANAAAQAGEELAERASAITETIDVKSALMADPSVDSTRLDVDTNYRTRTVTLNGYVPTETEKDMAEVIAKAQAEGYTVVNRLMVKPR